MLNVYKLAGLIYVYLLSLPSWECGLKLSLSCWPCAQNPVTPYVGVWIEIHPFIRSLEAGLIQRFTNILSLFESHFSLEYAIIYRKMED